MKLNAYFLESFTVMQRALAMFRVQRQGTKTASHQNNLFVFVTSTLVEDLLLYTMALSHRHAPLFNCMMSHTVSGL